MVHDKIRLTQIRRMLSEPFADLAEAQDTIRREPQRLAAALVAEAAASDDVASLESAQAYIAARIIELGDLLPPTANASLAAAVSERLQTWA